MRPEANTASIKSACYELFRARALVALAEPMTLSCFDGGELYLTADPEVTAALEGAHGAINAVSLYVEHGGETFRAVHVDAAARVARVAREAGVKHLAHVSGIGSDPQSPARYIKARGEGEQAVQRAFAKATLIRPSVMFGSDD